MTQTQYPQGAHVREVIYLNKKMHLGKFIKISQNKKSYLIHCSFSWFRWAGEMSKGD